MMNNKKKYTAPTAIIVHLEPSAPITTSKTGGYSDDVYDGDANSRSYRFDDYDDDDSDYDQPSRHRETDYDW